MKTLFATAATLALLSVAPVSASTVSNTFTVHANNNVWNEGKGADDILNTDPGLNTGITLNLGDAFTASVTQSADTWKFCPGATGCTVDASGIRVDSGTPLGLYNDSGFSFNFGTLVARIGAGDFFQIGTAGFDGTANASGQLRFYHWDHNTNNSGSLGVTVTSPAPAVPLPAGLPLLAAGLGAFAIAGRRASASKKR